MFELTHDEIARLVDNNFLPLIREQKPECTVGTQMPLVKTPDLVTNQADGTQLRTVGEILLSITVTMVVRKAKGGWAIHFKVVDRRGNDKFLAPQRGQVHPEQYVTSVHRAMDDLSVAPSPEIDEKVRKQAALTRERSRQQQLGVDDLPIEKQLGKLINLGAGAGVDTSKDTRVIKARLRSMSGKIAKAS